MHFMVVFKTTQKMQKERIKMKKKTVLLKNHHK